MLPFSDSVGEFCLDGTQLCQCLLIGTPLAGIPSTTNEATRLFWLHQNGCQFWAQPAHFECMKKHR